MQEFIILIRKKCKIYASPEDGMQVFNFLSALYATIGKVYHINRTYDNQMESKVYLGGMHNRYGYKVEVSVLPLGFAVLGSKHYPDLVADVSIFRDKLAQHVWFTAKNAREKTFLMLMVVKRGLKRCIILFDKEFVEAQRDGRAIILKNKA